MSVVPFFVAIPYDVLTADGPASRMIRHSAAELMDDPAIDPALHAQALRGLERINRWSLAADPIWRRVAGLAAEGPVRVLDIATGAGDLPRGLWRAARRVRVPVVIHGCDRSATAVDYARRQAARIGAPIEFFTWDAFADPLPEGYDVVTCSLFLHHLSRDAAVAILRRMAEAAGRMVVASDLVRSRPGLALAWLGTRALSRSPIVHVDGPRSVRAAYTLPEIRVMAEAAGLRDAAVIPAWPCRYLLTWTKRGQAFAV